MSEKAITIYTPASAAPHITAEDDAFIYDSLLGGRSGFLGEMTCSVQDGAAVISGGGVSNRGYVLRIPVGQNVTLSIPSGTQGVGRIDAVVSQFTKGGGETADSHMITIIKGTPSGAPRPPALTQSELRNLGDVNQIALFYIRLSGIEITSVTRAAKRVSLADSPTVYVQQNQPSAPVAGDLWLW